MSKTLIIYNSHTGITKTYAEEISAFLESEKVSTTIVSIDDFKPDHTKDTNRILFGCWTHGLMIFLQHPEKKWVKFAKSLPEINHTKTGLFTTYKLATGSMFKKMRKVLLQKSIEPVLELKSKDGSLSENDKILLKAFIQ